MGASLSHGHTLKRSSSKSHGKSAIFDKIDVIVEDRVGKLPMLGRYHLPPRRIEEDYEVCREILGTGFNGNVVKAKSKNQVTSQQTYAIKAFKVKGLTAEMKTQLIEEVEIFLCMDHPHITRLYDVYESEDYISCVMECMEGGELFDRLMERKWFTERDAADAVWQMLLALNYIHSHGIVHRDLKLENFLYDSRGSDHLKLIDFGFSKIWDPSMKTHMHASCGTLSYVAPEVLSHDYTSQCDLWSLGVIVFILLSGYMPFAGSEATQMRNISAGAFSWKPERWGNISKEARNFVESLLHVDHLNRLNAKQALEHTWIVQRHEAHHVKLDEGIVNDLRQFAHAAKFRRCCMEMMAWSLSNEERSKVEEYFEELDTHHQGTICLEDLRHVLVDKLHVTDQETCEIFHAMDTTHHDEIHYSDFLAAMVSTRIALHDDLLRATFQRFDIEHTGYITVENLRDVLGDTFEGLDVSKLLQEADMLQDGRIDYDEFVNYLRGDPIPEIRMAAMKMIDKHREGKGVVSRMKKNLSNLSFLNAGALKRSNTENSESTKRGPSEPASPRSNKSGVTTPRSSEPVSAEGSTGKKPSPRSSGAALAPVSAAGSTGKKPCPRLESLHARIDAKTQDGSAQGSEQCCLLQ